jgi:ABC-type multidrug transport system ATPase subunit/ABC-type multidrug transport system permease subunit
MSNVFMPGELWAVMGPSGCGKSTLLNVLGNRVYKSDCEGAVYVNDSMVTKELSRRFGYVMQDDVMYENLTVLETLEYAVRLRRGKMRISTKWKERIDKVLDDLGLTHCKHSRIGGFFHRGLSGGEKRRVSIALQLLKNEQTVLLLDEPSSGLDSSTAHQMLKTLRNVATKRNQIVVCTIHQPHSKMYKLFDKVLLLSHGHVLYAGDADKAVDYFSILGYPVQDHTNPSDHMLELASGVVFSKEKSTADISFSDETCDSKIEQLAQEYSNSTLCAMNEQEALSHIPKHAAEKKRKRLSTPIRYFLKEWSRLFILISRNIKEEMHSPINLLFRVSCAVFVALLLGLLYYNLQPNVESILDRQGALFFLPVNLSIFPVFLVLNTFIKEKRIYSREHEQGLYASFTYYLNKVIGELPFLLPLPIIFSLIAYPMMNLQHDVQHWFVGTLTLVFLTLCAQSLGLLISTYSPNINIANIISPIVFSVLLLFTGLFVNISNIPVYFRWISYINYAKYGFESIAFNDLYNLPLKCAEECNPFINSYNCSNFL